MVLPEVENDSKTSATLWWDEIGILLRSSGPLVLTFLLQYSLPIVGLIVVGRLGNVELAAASLGGMTASITCYSAYQGLSGALDTLCAQAYGGGNKKLVGLHLQRMVIFVWLFTIPIAVLWTFSENILSSILTGEKETVRLAAKYLRILIFGAPGYAAFECGKRFLQAQGIFTANLYILLCLAPVNAFLQWFLVLHLKLGFIGSPIAVAVTNNLLAFSVAFYVLVLGHGKQCWSTSSPRDLFSNWGPMVRLAIPGLAMSVSEWLCFEILTLWAGLFSSDYLAAQGVLINLGNFSAQAFIATGTAASNRVANLIGANDVKLAKVAARVAIGGSLTVSAFTMMVLIFGKYAIPDLFSLKDDAKTFAVHMIPIIATFLLLDATNTALQGILRGIGAQRVGGYAALIIMNGVSLPLSYVTGFTLHWYLLGLWFGPIIGVTICIAISGPYLYFTSWDVAVEEANLRAPLLPGLP